MTGAITCADEPRLFAFTWGAGQLSWELAPDGDGTPLTLVHTFGGAGSASRRHLRRTALSRLLDGESVCVAPDRGEPHEAYTEQIGLGRGVAEGSAGGPRIRFERELVRPVETVRAELPTEGKPLAGAPAPEGFAE